MTVNLKVILLCGFIWLAGNAVAAGPDVYVPDELKPWEAWFLEGKEAIARFSSITLSITKKTHRLVPTRDN